MPNAFATVPDANVPAYDLKSPEVAQRLTSRTVTGVRVLDFGQGDCNAVIVRDPADPTKYEAVLYFDMGGGKHAGSKTHPWHEEWKNEGCANNVPELSLKPKVVLSHWDGDHYSTAYYIARHDRTDKLVPNEAKRLRRDLLSLEWLAPRQCKHPSPLDLARELSRLSCWPTGVSKHTFALDATTRVVIEKCIGGSGPYDPNLDGLAMRVERHDASGAVEEQFLMPGDAPFHVIPSCTAGTPLEVQGLLAFHHGSETHMIEAKACIPKPSPSGAKIIYTFGLKPSGGRCYGHPHEAAIEKYENRRWTVHEEPSGGFPLSWPPTAGATGSPGKRGSRDLEFTPPAPVPVVMQRYNLRPRQKRK